MRARIKINTNILEESLVGLLKENVWLPEFDQESKSANEIRDKVRESLDNDDTETYDNSKQHVVVHTGTETEGVLSKEGKIWILRILNHDVHYLRRASESFVKILTHYANTNSKSITYPGRVQIVPVKRKDIIIEGEILATQSARKKYAKKIKGLELITSKIMLFIVIALLLITYPWNWASTTTGFIAFLLSLCKNITGPVMVTALLTYTQYRFFHSALKQDSISWTIPSDS